MAVLAVLLIILGSAAYQFRRGNAVKAFAALLASICAAIAAFAYFEPLASLLIASETLVAWAQPVCLLALFLVCLAVLQTVALAIIPRPIVIELLHDQIGRIIFGLLLGLVVSGVLVTALAMAPLANNLPYQRFDSRTINADEPHGLLLGADTFVAGSFGLISKGSLSGDKSFAVLHADFINQLFLNRCNREIPATTDPAAIELPPKAAWLAPDDIRDSQGQPVPAKAGHRLTIVRSGFTGRGFATAGRFTLSQFRLLSAQKGAQNRLAGKALPAYPVGYLTTGGRVQIKSLSDTITLENEDVSGTTRWIDFAFWVQDGLEPVLLQFKANVAAAVSSLAPSDQLPPPSPFVPASACARLSADISPLASSKIHGLKLTYGAELLKELSLHVADEDHLQSLQTPDSKIPAVFDSGAIVCAQVQLNPQRTAEPNTAPAEANDAAQPSEQAASRATAENKLPDMLKAADGYRVLSLKCNNPPTGAAISADQLPVLVDLYGRSHPPVGAIVTAKVGQQTVYELDFCSLTGDQKPAAIKLTEDNIVAAPFPDVITLPERASSISEFYLLYMIKTGRNTIITSVKPADAAMGAAIVKYDGVVIR